jgi:hypothetical protein
VGALRAAEMICNGFFIGQLGHGVPFYLTEGHTTDFQPATEE